MNQSLENIKSKEKIKAVYLYSYCILILGIFSVTYFFFSIFGLISIFEYQAWIIFIFSLSPYISIILLKTFTFYFSNKIIRLPVISTAISFFGFYWYLLTFEPSSEKTGLIFIAIPIYQWILVLCFSILSWFLSPKKSRT
jgi:hypothetical protein